MRYLLLLLLVSPLTVFSQINRSANELAREQVQLYVSKLFNNSQYEPGTFGQLQSYTEKNNANGVCWSLRHDFLLKEKGRKADDRLFRFIFFLDKRMNIQRAESFLTIDING